MSETKAPSAYTIQKIVAAAHQALLEIELQGAEPTTDEAELMAALASEGIDVAWIMRRLLLAATEAKANAAAIKARRADLAIREAREEKHEETWRAAALSIMSTFPELFPGGRFKCPEVSASIRTGKPGIVITNEAAIPDQYMRLVKQPDKARIGADLAEGVIVEGAELRNPMPFISIRTS